MRDMSPVSASRLVSSCKWLWERFRDCPAAVRWRKLWKATLCQECTRYWKNPITDCNCPDRVRNADTGLIEAAAIGEMTLVRKFAARAKHCGWAIYTASRHGHTDVATHLSTGALPIAGSWIDIQNRERAVHTLVDYGLQVKNGPRTAASIFALKFAGYYGDVEALQSGRLCDWSFSRAAVVFRIAAEQGHLNVLQWGMYVAVRYITDAIRFAARAGHVHCIDWWLNVTSADGLFRSIDEMYRCAAQGGHSDVLATLHKRYPLHSQGVSLEYQMSTRAIVHNQLEVLQWMHAKLFTFEARYRDLSYKMRLRRLARRRGCDDIANYIASLQ